MVGVDQVLEKLATVVDPDLKKDIVYNIFENCNFRFDEWFSKKSYIDIYFFMSGLIFDFTAEHKIYIFSIFVN